MMNSRLRTVFRLREILRLRPFGRLSGRDWALYFVCLAAFAVVVAAGNWVAERSAGDELETWIGSSAAFLLLAFLTKFSARLRG